MHGGLEQSALVTVGQYVACVSVSVLQRVRTSRMTVLKEICEKESVHVIMG